MARPVEIEMVGGPKDGERTIAPAHMQRMHYLTERDVRMMFNTAVPVDSIDSSYHRYERDPKQPKLFRYVGLVDDPQP